jgi:hypothetical protein
VFGPPARSDPPVVPSSPLPWCLSRSSWCLLLDPSGPAARSNLPVVRCSPPLPGVSWTPRVLSGSPGASWVLISILVVCGALCPPPPSLFVWWCLVPSGRWPCSYSLVAWPSTGTPPPPWHCGVPTGCCPCSLTFAHARVCDVNRSTIVPT